MHTVLKVAYLSLDTTGENKIWFALQLLYFDNQYHSTHYGEVKLGLTIAEIIVQGYSILSEHYHDIVDFGLLKVIQVFLGFPNLDMAENCPE